MRREFYVFDERPAGISAALDTEADDGACTFRQILLRQVVAGVRRQVRMIYPCNLFVIVQIVEHRFRVGQMLVHAQRQCLDSLQ